MNHMTDRELLTKAREVAQRRRYYAYMSGAMNCSPEKFDQADAEYRTLEKELRDRGIKLI